MFYLYKITNSKNQKMYIGQTTNVSRRWSQHKSCANKNKGCRKLTNAIRKYGIENFYIEIINESANKESANQLETKLIIQFDSIKNGYNITSGGEGVIGYHHPLEIKKQISEIMKTKSHLIGKDHGGIKAPISKLTANDIIEIRQLLESKTMFQKDIAILYGVNPSAISTIKAGKTYKNY